MGGSSPRWSPARWTLARWLAVPLVVLPLGWLLFTGLGRDPREIPSPLIGHPLPSFAATTLNGTTFSSAQLAGRPAIVAAITVSSGRVALATATAGVAASRPRANAAAAKAARVFAGM